MNFNSRTSTNAEQSRRLLALGLKPETADMSIIMPGTNMETLRAMPYAIFFKLKGTGRGIPSWSLSRLLEMMPDRAGEFTFKILYPTVGYFTSDVGHFYNNADIFDSCVEMIEWLIKNGNFEKEYLKKNDNEQQND